jgi:hypothetical protein
VNSNSVYSNKFNNYYESGLVEVNNGSAIQKQLFLLIEQSAVSLDSGIAVKFIEQGDSFFICTTKDAAENNALHLACQKINKVNCDVMLDIIAILISKGISVDTPNAQNMTPLHLLCGLNFIPTEIIKTFIKLGANVDIYDKNGNTPFHILCANVLINEDKEVLSSVECLLENCTSHNAINLESKTVLDLAVKTSKYQIAILLMKKCAIVSKTIVDHHHRYSFMDSNIKKFDTQLQKYYKNINYYFQLQREIRDLETNISRRLSQSVPNNTQPLPLNIQAANNSQHTEKMIDSEDVALMDEEAYNPQQLPSCQTPQNHLLTNQGTEEQAPADQWAEGDWKDFLME